MLEKGKISAFQMAFMMYPAVLATGFLALPTISAQYAKNDLWLTGILASLVGMITVYMATWLHELYPKQTIIQYSERIIGTIPGKIVGLIFFLFCLNGTGTITREYAEFVTSSFLFKTPVILVISSMLLLAAVAVRGGAEMLARSAMIFTPVFIFPVIFLLLLIPDLDARNILPVMSRGIIPVLKGSFAPQAWVSEFFVITFLLPCLTDPENGRKWGMISLCTVIISMTFVNLITLFLLGPDTGNKTYPILVTFRYIKVANFFENLEALVLAMWVAGNFVKISVFYYATVLSFAQCLKLSDYRPVVFPLGILAIVFGLWDLPSFPRLAFILRYVNPFYFFVVLILIPLLLLITALFRKQKATGEGEPVR